MNEYLVCRGGQSSVRPTAATDREVVEPAPAHGLRREVPGHVVSLVVGDQEHQGQGQGEKSDVPAVVVTLHCGHLLIQGG